MKNTLVVALAALMSVGIACAGTTRSQLRPPLRWASLRRRHLHFALGRLSATRLASRCLRVKVRQCRFARPDRIALANFAR